MHLAGPSRSRVLSAALLTVVSVVSLGLSSSPSTAADGAIHMGVENEAPGSTMLSFDGSGPTLDLRNSGSGEGALKATGSPAIFADGGEGGIGVYTSGAWGLEAAGDSFGARVWARGPGGTGILTEATGPGSEGVDAWTSGGTAIKARDSGAKGTAIHAEGATALHAVGKTRFSRSGRVTVSSGDSSFTKVLTGADAIGSATMVLANLQQRRVGIYVEAVVPHPASDAFTIHLNKPVAHDTIVAWFLLN